MGPDLNVAEGPLHITFVALLSATVRSHEVATLGSQTGRDLCCTVVQEG